MLALILSNPIARWLAFGALCFAAIVVAYNLGKYSGAGSARAECREAAVRAELAASKRDLAIARGAADNAAALGRDLEAQADLAKGRIDELEKEVSRRPVERQCLLDADGVRDITGGAAPATGAPATASVQPRVRR